MPGWANLVGEACKVGRVKFWNRRNRTIVVGAVPVVAIFSLLGLPSIPGTDINLTVPYAAEGNGPTFNTLGEVDGRQIVDISGAKTHPTSGNLNMTTVSVRTNMTLAQALKRWVSTDDTLVPIEHIFPSGKSSEEVQRQNAAAFANSESNATISAMNHLNKPLETMALEISEDSPAQGKIEVNDIITKVDGEKITLPSELSDKIKGYKPGDEVTVTVKRQEKDKDIKVKLAELPEEVRGDHPKDTAFLGVTAVAQPGGNIKVEYNLTDIGGPSAGLMFSMAVVDKLTPEELTGGKFVAGTGTIDAAGKVGPIGGITHKIAAAKEAGAEVFLVPAQNCAEAVHEPPEGITLLKVDTLDDAIKDLKDYNDGKQADTCK